MGGDEAVLLSDRAFAGADTWATSFTIGKAIETIGPFDLILCGRQAIDGDTAQVGPQVADYLNVPQVSYVKEIERIDSTSVIVKRQLENGYERIECALPALLTVISPINKPRYAHVGRMIDACSEKAHIKVLNAADIKVTTSEIGLDGSLTHVVKTYTPDFKREGKIFEGTNAEVVSDLLRSVSQSDAVSTCKAFAALCELS